MTTPTTNFGWLKPDPEEPVSLSVYNQWLDDFDADMKSKETERAVEIPFMAEYRLVTGSGYLAGQDQFASSTSAHNISSRPLVWEKVWEPFYYNSGGFDNTTLTFGVPSNSSRLEFTATGIYRFTYYFSFFNTTGVSGYLQMHVRNASLGADLPETLCGVRSQSYVGTTVLSHTSYLKVTASAGTVNVGDLLEFWLKTEASDSAAATLRINDADEWVRPRVQVEWVRPL